MAGFLGAQSYLKQRSRSTYVHCKDADPRHIVLLVPNQLLLVNFSFSSQTSHVFKIPQVGVQFETVLHQGLGFLVSPLVLIVNFAQFRINWKDYVHEGKRPGWAGLWVCLCVAVLTTLIEHTQSTVGSTIPWVCVLDCALLGKGWELVRITYVSTVALLLNARDMTRCLTAVMDELACWAK